MCVFENLCLVVPHTACHHEQTAAPCFLDLRNMPKTHDVSSHKVWTVMCDFAFYVSLDKHSNFPLGVSMISSLLTCLH